MDSDEVVTELVAEVTIGGSPTGRGAGGGRLSEGRSAVPLPSSKIFFNAVISCLKARFSDWDDPSSDRMASKSLSRSAISPSRVVIYSNGGGCEQ